MITDHIDGTECASCCDAFRKSWFPSLCSIVSHASWSSSKDRDRIGEGSRTHFACLSAVKSLVGSHREKNLGKVGIGSRTFGGKYGGKEDEIVELVGDGVTGLSIDSMGPTK